MSEENKEGIERDLTFGEKILVRSVFGFSIRYHSVKIRCDSYFPFGLQNKGTAMSPNGELWFRVGDYKKDFSTSYIEDRHLFLHEIAHVWQRQKGMWVRSRGLFSWAADYHYILDGGKKLKDYSMEQQASLISDYWLLSEYGHDTWFHYIGRNIVMYRGGGGGNVLKIYEEVLSDFIKERYR